MTLAVHPQPDGTAVLSWNNQPVAQMRSNTAPAPEEAPGEPIYFWELMTYGKLHLSARTPDALLAELEERIRERLNLSGA